MKKKIIYIMIAFTVLILVFVFLNQDKKVDTDLKDINIKIVVDENIIVDDTFKTKKRVLSDLLIELSNKKQIVLEYSNTEFGMYIVGLGKDKLFKEDPSEGVYWIYSSDNNKKCVQDGYCVAASDLNIDDEDCFVFELKAYE